MKLFIIFSLLFVGVIATDYNQQLLETASEIRKTSKVALRFLKNHPELKEDEKTLQQNLAEMDTLTDDMKQEPFRAQPVYSMETKLMANERAVVFEIRQALFKRTKELFARADKAVGQFNDPTRTRAILEQKMVLKKLFDKMAKEEQDDKYIRLEKETIKEQNKMENLLRQVAH